MIAGQGLTDLNPFQIVGNASEAPVKKGGCFLTKILPFIAMGAAGGAAKGILGARQARQQREHEKELAKIHTTKPGFSDFGEDLIEDEKISRFGFGKPIDFSLALPNKNKIFRGY